MPDYRAPGGGLSFWVCYLTERLRSSCGFQPALVPQQSVLRNGETIKGAEKEEKEDEEEGREEEEKNVAFCKCLCAIGPPSRNLEGVAFCIIHASCGAERGPWDLGSLISKAYGTHQDLCYSISQILPSTQIIS